MVTRTPEEYRQKLGSKLLNTNLGLIPIWELAFYLDNGALVVKGDGYAIACQRVINGEGKEVLSTKLFEEIKAKIKAFYDHRWAERDIPKVDFDEVNSML